MKKRIRLGVAIALAAMLVTTGFSQSRRPNERTASQLSEAQRRLKEDGRVESAAEMIKSRLENQDTDELIRQAQERLKSLKQGDRTTAPANPEPVAAAKPVTVARAAPVAENPPPATPVRAEPVEVAAMAAVVPDNPVPVTETASASSPAPAPVPSVAAPAPDPAPSVAANPNVPPPKPLTPRYDRERKENATMEITSRESQMDGPRHLVTFSGDVLVEHPGFTLKGEELVIYLHEDEAQPGETPTGAEEDRPPFKRAIATGPMVEIERIGADGKVQIAKARRADYNALTGDIELSGGPPTLQNGDSLINPKGEDAKIFLTKDGKHRVTGGEGGKVKMEFDLGPQGKSTGNIGPSFGTGGLDAITDRNRND